MSDFFKHLMASSKLVRKVASDRSVWWVKADVDVRPVPKFVPLSDDAVLARLRAMK